MNADIVSILMTVFAVCIFAMVYHAIGGASGIVTMCETLHNTLDSFREAYM